MTVSASCATGVTARRRFAGKGCIVRRALSVGGRRREVEDAICISQGQQV